MNRDDTVPPAARRLVALVGLFAAVALAAASTSIDLSAWTTSATVLVFVSTVSAALPLRLRSRGAVHGINLDEAALVPAVLLLPGALAVPVLIIPMAVVRVARGQPALKVVFNVATATLGALGAVAVVSLVGPGDPTTLAAVVAGVGAAAAYQVITIILAALLFRALEGIEVSEALGRISGLGLWTTAGSTVFGLLLAIAMVAVPLAGLLGAALLGALLLGYRGAAELSERDARNEEMRALSDVLAEGMQGDAAIDAFLRRLRRLFHSGAAELLLLDADPQRLHRSSEDADELLAPTAAWGVTQRAAREGDVASDDRDDDDAIAVPVKLDGRIVGVLAVRERTGLEVNDERDVAMLVALGNELGVALHNVELFATVAVERGRYEREATKLGDIIRSASDGIALLDPSGRVQTWNPAMANLTGIEPQDAIGEIWEDLGHLRDREGRDLLRSPDLAHHLDAEPGTQEPLEVEVVRPDGQQRWLRAVLSRLRQGDEESGIVVVARDITRERETEAIKTDFIAVVSHELRTPLTPLKGFLQMLTQGGGRVPPERQGQVFDAMQRQVDRLDALIGDLLVVADLDRGSVELDAVPLDITEVARVAATTEAARSPDRLTVEVGPAAGAIVVTDRQAVMRVVRALVSNALKHTTERVEVRLHIRDGDACIDVVDHGPGIASEDRDRIFETFGRLGTHLDWTTQGPGLGLSIARSLAERLGGKLDVQSTIGVGSTFTLRLPLAGGDILEQVGIGA